MASEQATAAAVNIASWLRLEAHQFPSDGNVSEWAEIIDAAFAPVVAEQDALKATVKEFCRMEKAFGEDVDVAYAEMVMRRHGIE